MLRALDRAVRHSVPKPTALIVNFPSNPTALLAPLDFYKELVAFCRQHELFILTDLAYAEIYFGDLLPPSVLQVPGAKDIAVEFTSMSKTYSMPGWRMGFAAGNPRLIAALARVKSYLDYGAFTPIQVAAAAALNGPQDCVQEMRDLYRDRRDVLVKGLRAAGWDVPAPEGSMFAWAPIPERFRQLGSVDFSKLLLAQGQGRGRPGHRLRRAWRRPCAHRAGREQAPHPPGAAQHPRPSCRATMLRPGAVPDAMEVDCAHEPSPSRRRGRRPRHGRRRRAEAAARQCRHHRRARRPADRGHRRLGARPQRATAACRSPACAGTRIRWRSPPIPSVDVVVELIGGSEGPAKALVEAALARRQAGGHGEQGAAGRAWRGAGRLGRGEGRAAGLRGRGGRRHPGHQGAARGAGGQPHLAASPAS